MLGDPFMSLMDILDGAGNGGLGTVGRSLGIDPKMTEALASQLVPAISSGVKRRAAQPGGLNAVLATLKGEGQTGYLSNPSRAASPEAQRDGADFLAQILGGADRAPHMAQAAAERVGASPEEAGRLLPALAAMLQGGLQTKAPDAEISAAQSAIQASKLDRSGKGLSDLATALAKGTAPSGGILSALKSVLGLGHRHENSDEANTGQLGGLLSMLDKDGDGSPLDDILDGFMSR